MQLQSPLGLSEIPSETSHASPNFLLELEPRTPAFFRNFRDLLLFRTVPKLDEYPRAPFWNDVFVYSRSPWRGVLGSTAGHLALFATVYGLLQLPLFQEHPRKLVDPLDGKTITYYNVSEYLPPLAAKTSPAKQESKGQPSFSRQEIISVAPEADNPAQTIVVPPKVRLNAKLAMPNIVQWDSVPVAQPTAASRREISQLTRPEVKFDILTPTADVTGTESKFTLPSLRPEVVEPTADVSEIAVRHTKVPQLAVVEPVAVLNDLARAPGSINISRPAIDVVSPKLAVSPQRVVADSFASGGSGAAKAAGSAPPSLEGMQTSRGSGQLVALSLDPPNLQGPMHIPEGSRGGVFATGPSGMPGAPGTPDLKGGGTGSGGANVSSAEGGPAGISIGAPPIPAAPTNSKAGISLNPAQKQVLMASIARPSLPTPARPVVPDLDAPGTGVERSVFGSKKFYSMVLNMPNLTSRSGSWVIKFAELKQPELNGDLLAPVATLKVDPAYPADLVRDGVEGTVVLYAIIHSDGRVGDVKVLSGIDDRLDHNAMKALLRWHFRPATRNGEGVALEAVVQIPFRVHLPF